MKRILGMLVLLLSHQLTFAIGCDTASIFFDPGKAQIRANQQKKLNALLAQKAPGRGVSIIGFTDNVGEEASNLNLSQARAKAVRDYLLTKGWSRENIGEVVGAGEANSAGNDTTGNAMNRRVDIIPFYNFVGKDSVDFIFYEPGTDTILPNHVFKKEKLLDIMRDNPCLMVSVEGHTCCAEHTKFTPTYGANSISRANVIWNHLISNGIDQKRIKYSAKGTQYPLIANPKNDAEHARNCRVEIKVQ